MTVRNTPLYGIHKKLGAKMVDFHGWRMPVQYSSILEEHKSVREKVGIFDVSHMGEIEVKGEHAKELLQWLTPNDLNQLEDGRVQYSALMNENGGVIDDLLIYAISKERYFLCVNASNVGKDVNWLADHALQYPDVEVVNVSRRYGMISVQGPNAESLFRTLTKLDVTKMEYYTFSVVMIGEHNCILSRTGYTGEDGFEIFCEWRDAPQLWEYIMGKGKHFGIKPIGLGARDTLRMEMRYPLHGQELDENTTPLEAGLDWIVKLNKESEFICMNALLKQKENGVDRKIVGLTMMGRGIPRSGYAVFHNDEKVGEITSGTMSPTLKKAIGIGYVRPDLAVTGTTLYVEIRGAKVEAEVSKTPFVESHVKRSKPAEALQQKTVE